MKLLNTCRLILLIMVIGVGQNIFSQETIIWNSVSTPVRFSSKWQMPVDISYRTIGFSSSAYQYTFRTGLKRFINDIWSAAAGVALFYTRTSFEKSDHEFGRELRFWQDVAAENGFKNRIILQNRFRVEGRFFAATQEKRKYQAIRLRYRLGLVKFLGERFKVQLAEEFMEHYSSRQFSFQQNRVYFSASYLFDKLTQIEAGYMWSRIPGINRHYMTISFQRTILFHGDRKSKR
ncbi:MAG: DUF2490 domain-containing protein [Bacteroidetes bacterium]|nr:DUF2490 domain-containing protein [Bacteroidota bacterium]